MKNKLPIIIIGVTVLGLAAYFGYRHYKYSTGDPAKNNLKIKIQNRG